MLRMARFGRAHPAERSKTTKLERLEAMNAGATEDAHSGEEPVPKRWGSADIGGSVRR